MKIPIANAIYDNNLDISNLLKKKDNLLSNLKFLKFEKVDKKRFPIVTLLNDKILKNSAPIILNASNEILVDSFIKKKIPYNEIYQYLKRVFKDRDFNKYAIKKTPNINEIYKIDDWARKKTIDIIRKKIMKNTFIKILLLSIIYIFPFNLNAEILKKIEISGNERIVDETILIYGDIQKNKDYSQNEIDQIIKKLYETKFFSKI